MLRPEWEEFFGFNLFDIDQTVEFSAPPTSVTVMRGRFEADALTQQWEAEGYQEQSWPTGAYYKIDDDFAGEFESERSRLAMASANYMAVLAPDLIAFAPSEQLITMVLDLAAGTGQSLADELNIASLVQGVPDDLASGIIVSGTSLLATGDPAIFLTGTPDALNLEDLATRTAESVAEAAAMPPLTVALLGSTAGGPVDELATSTLSPEDIPAAKAVAVVVTVNDAAAWTVAEVIDARLQRDDGPLVWSDFFTAGRSTSSRRSRSSGSSWSRRPTAGPISSSRCSNGASSASSPGRRNASGTWRPGSSVAVAAGQPEADQDQERDGEQDERHQQRRLQVTGPVAAVDRQRHRLRDAGKIAGEHDGGAELAEGAGPGQHGPRRHPGNASGNVTVVKTRSGGAPRSAAADSRSASMRAKPPLAART